MGAPDPLRAYQAALYTHGWAGPGAPAPAGAPAFGHPDLLLPEPSGHDLRACAVCGRVYSPSQPSTERFCGPTCLEADVFARRSAERKARGVRPPTRTPRTGEESSGGVSDAS